MASKRFNFKAPENPEPVYLEINDDKIQCVPTLDGLRLLLFTSLLHGNFALGVRAKEITDFLRDVILPEEWDRFEGLVKKYQIDVEGLADMAGYLADEYSERPTGPAQPSSDGQTNTGPSSEVNSSSPESVIPI